MGLFIGIDEAGYGPNLGPLVVSATAWEVPGDAREVDLWGKFAGIVEQSAPVNQSHIQIADSKQVYTPARGIENLEAGVLGALAVLRGGALPATGSPQTFRELCRQIGIPPRNGFDAAVCETEPFDGEPWFSGTDLPLKNPCKEALSQTWLDCCRSHGIRLRAICSDVVLTRRFNEQTRLRDSKGWALSEITMNVLQHIWQEADGDGHKTVLVIADKHGGRNRYHEFLPIVFEDRFIRCHNESTAQSRYSVGKADIRFETKSERHLPVALASMVSKYLRELAMILFNRFWTDRQPGLKPTAGYPLDATRFRADIATLQKQLGIDDEILWRHR